MGKLKAILMFSASVLGAIVVAGLVTRRLPGNVRGFFQL